MKFSLITVAASLAVASATDCDLTKISPLLTNPNVATCTADSGFSFTALSAPTAETLPKLCASTACKTVLTAVKSLGLGDCTLLGMKLETDLVTPIQTACAKSSSSSNSTSASNSTTSAGSKAGTATVGSTAAPTTTTKPSTSSGSGASASTVSTLAPTSTPAPTTAKSGASSVAMAMGAVVVAIAAAMF